MSTVSKHATGTFCWPELVTTDIAAAKAFYCALFGWTVIDHDMGPNGIYTIYQQGGRDCAAMFKLSPEMAAADVPVRWGPYVSVDSADESAKRATELGGEVIMGPFDVDQNGRSAIVRDLCAGERGGLSAVPC